MLYISDWISVIWPKPRDSLLVFGYPDFNPVMASYSRGNGLLRCLINTLHTSVKYQVNDEGYTPLMEASREGHEEMVALLLSQGKTIKIDRLLYGNKLKN